MSAASSLIVKQSTRHRLAFTLVELLVVIGVMVTILGICVPAITGMKTAGDVSKAVYDIDGLLEQARAYAMSSNTYVYVGFFEADETKSSLGIQVAGVGRVAMAVVASTTGLRGYDPVNSPAASWAANYASGANLLSVGAVRCWDNLHLVDLGTRPTSGGMARPPFENTTDIAPAYNIGNATCGSQNAVVTTFDYPLGVPAGTGQYTFSKVIQYDPQGVARIQTTWNGTTITSQIEIGLEGTNGNEAPALTPPVMAGNVAAIQIDAVSGVSHIYRP
jgi:type II secretory pathway pseudopilin PulG